MYASFNSTILTTLYMTNSDVYSHYFIAVINCTSAHQFDSSHIRTHFRRVKMTLFQCLIHVIGKPRVHQSMLLGLSLVFECEGKSIDGYAVWVLWSIFTQVLLQLLCAIHFSMPFAGDNLHVNRRLRVRTVWFMFVLNVYNIGNILWARISTLASCLTTGFYFDKLCKM